MAIPARKGATDFTYADYCTWPDEERWEIINGVALAMTPAPSRIHQKVSRELQWQLQSYFRTRKCELYSAPFDVVLPESGENDDQIKTVVQPDLVVVCDKKKLNDRGCRGAPDLVIEITSPPTAARDLKDKLMLYEHHSVKEYWIVQPGEQVVTVYRLNKAGLYGRPTVLSRSDIITTPLFRGLTVDLTGVFGE